MKTELLKLLKLNRNPKRKQEIVGGIVLIIIAALSLFIPNEYGKSDGTAALLLIPIGLISVGGER